MDEFDYMPAFIGEAKVVAIEIINKKALLVDLIVESQKPRVWNPQSWRGKPVAQDIEYPDQVALDETFSCLRQLPPLVSTYKIEHALWELSEVAKGRAFIIQGGDCAESFHDVRIDIIRSKFTLLAEQTEILSRTLRKPIVQIGRIAGQYAKSCSNAWETLSSGKKVQAFRGHNVNSATLCNRTPDPQRLLLGYFYAATTLNAISQFEFDNDIQRSTLDCTLPSPFFTSHEALHLPYEASLTKGDYNHSATFLWIGEGTSQIDGAHVEYARGLRNPIGIKIGPTTTAASIVALLDTLASDRSQPGKVSLITRLGRGNAESILPQMICAVQLSGHIPVWICDPCHGNTVTAANGMKTRMVEDMLAELEETYIVHRALGSYLGGIHLEQTGEEVTECQYEASETYAMDLKLNYRSLCDPRLTRFQALTLVESFGAFVNGYEEGLGIDE